MIHPMPWDVKGKTAKKLCFGCIYKKNRLHDGVEAMKLVFREHAATTNRLFQTRFDILSQQTIRRGHFR